MSDSVLCNDSSGLPLVGISLRIVLSLLAIVVHHCLSSFLCSSVANENVDPAVSGLFTSLIQVGVLAFCLGATCPRALWLSKFRPSYLQAAATLSPGAGEAPLTILIETDRRVFVVKEYDGMTVTVIQSENDLASD